MRTRIRWRSVLGGLLELAGLGFLVLAAFRLDVVLGLAAGGVSLVIVGIGVGAER